MNNIERWILCSFFCLIMTDQQNLFRRTLLLPAQCRDENVDADLGTGGLSTGSAGEVDLETGFDYSGIFSDPAEHFDAVSDGVDFSTSSDIQHADVLQVLEPENFAISLERAWVSVGARNDLKQPWETGIWTNIFGNSSRADVVTVPELKRLPIVPEPKRVKAAEQPASKRRRAEAVSSCWQQVVMTSDVATWEETMEAKLDMALKRWYDVIICFPTSFQVVAQLAEFKSVPEQLHMVRDILGFKSPLTLLKRANSMVRYLSYLREKNIVPPGQESTLYAFFLEQKESGAPQSRLASVVEAIRFSEHVVGLEIADVLLSKRCLGASRKKSDGPVKQAAPLTVAEMAALHQILADDEADLWDRVMSGSFLMCVYTRSRWMDLQHSDKVVADPSPTNPVFLELSISEFKTKNSNSWKEGLLVAVAPTTGVTCDNWGRQWLDVREAIDAPLVEGYPLMPAPDMEGNATKRPIGTAEAGNWLTMLLHRAGVISPGRKLTSHSGKATILSYLAKYGAELGVREILGAHVSHIKSVIRYSRDALAGPLRVLNQMLGAIRNQDFMPDQTRSGYFRDGWERVEGPEAFIISDDEQVKSEPIDEQDSSDECPDTGSSTDEEATVEAHCSRKVTLPSAPEWYRMFQHVKTRMLHLMHEDNSRVFGCGRIAGDKHEVTVSAKLRWDTPCCGRCWKSAGQPVGSRLV